MRSSYLNIITVAFFTTFLVLIASIYLTVQTTRDLYNSYDWVEHTYQVITNLEKLEKNIFKGSMDARGYFIAKEPELEKSFAQDTSILRNTVKDLKLLTKDNKTQQKNINDLQLQVDKRINLSLSAWIENINHNTEIAKKGIEQTNKSSREIGALINKMGNVEKTLLIQRKSKVLNDLLNTKKYLLFSAIPVLVIGFLFIFIVRRDIDRMRRFENELLELNENKIKFFSIISHDLRGPAYATQQLSQMIKDESNLSKEERDSLAGMLYESIRKVTSLLDDLLEWSRIQMNCIEYKPQIINLKNISRETIDRFRSLLENKKIIVHNLMDDDCKVFGDKYMTSTILRNLVSNAIKFTKAGRNVFISCTKNNEGSMEIRVRDEGIGMSEKMKESLFDIGTRQSTKGTSQETGTGLGLVLVKEFIEKQGGKIWVESEEGKGSNFIFTIPVNHAQHHLS